MASKDDQVKKKFNKRAYLKQKLKSNFGSQQEGHGKAFLQRKAVVRQYFRQQRREEQKQQKKLKYLNKNEVNSGSLTIPSGNNSAPNYSDSLEEDSAFTQPQKRKKLNNMRRAKAAYHEKINEKIKKKEDALRRKLEIEEAQKKYREKRLQRFKKLSKKTRRGQPVMSGRIELMLEKLQSENKA